LARRANAQQDPRQHLRDLSFDSEEAARQRAAIRTLIVHLDESGRASGRSSWTDLLKVFFE
jgi:hypothetical protein